jgi:hypothetical protein
MDKTNEWGRTPNWLPWLLAVLCLANFAATAYFSQANSELLARLEQAEKKSAWCGLKGIK